MSATTAAPDVLHERLGAAIAAVAAPGVNADLWAAVLDPFMWQAGIHTPARIAAFLGQVGASSSGLAVWQGTGLLPMGERATAFWRYRPYVERTSLYTPPLAAEAAAWLWRAYALNPLADAWLLGRITHALTGADDPTGNRIRLTHRAHEALTA